LVGSSGSGKSMVARCVSRLERPDAGQIWVGDTDISRLGNHDLRPCRSEIQMIFQDAVTSMNPRFSAAQIIEKPLLIQGRGGRENCGAGSDSAGDFESQSPGDQSADGSGERFPKKLRGCAWRLPMKYLGRRLLRAGLLLVGVSALCFLFTEMAPGSFFDEMRL